jgi:small subunit ribosomal protein S20
MVRTYIKKVDAEIAGGNYDSAQAAFLTAQPIIDGMVNKGIFPKNRAARIKSTLNTRVKALKA